MRNRRSCGTNVSKLHRRKQWFLHHIHTAHRSLFYTGIVPTSIVEPVLTTEKINKLLMYVCLVP